MRTAINNDDDDDDDNSFSSSSIIVFNVLLERLEVISDMINHKTGAETGSSEQVLNKVSK